jgi:hypothetical protein
MLELYLGRSLRKVKYETVIFPKQPAQEKREWSQRIARQHMTVLHVLHCWGELMICTALNKDIRLSNLSLGY